MKKSFILLVTFLGSFLMSSCSERNDPNNPSGSKDDSSNENIEDVNQIKYLSEWEHTYTYIASSDGGENANVGKIIKYIYERRDDLKYIKSFTIYTNENIDQKITYQNVGNADFGVYAISASTPSYVGSSADTTYWYDKSRTLPEKTIGTNQDITTFTYNSKGLLTSQNTYFQDKLRYASNYSYSNNYRYGKTTTYDFNTGEESISTYDTLLYEDFEKQHIKQSRSWTILDTEGYTHIQMTIGDYENGIFGVNRLILNTTKKDIIKFNNQISQTSSSWEYNYSYQDELNYSYELKSFDENKNLVAIENYKYKYVR